MREFSLPHAVAAFSSYGSSVTSLWGLYITATFAASGFAASKLGKLPTLVALLLSIGYLVLSFAHLVGVGACLKGQEAISKEVLRRLKEDRDLTDYPATVAAVLRIPLSRRASWAIHAFGDSCVVGIIWFSALSHAPGR